MRYTGIVPIISCLVAALATTSAAPPAAAQPDVSILDWTPAGTRSPYVRILSQSTVLAGPDPNYFAEPEAVSLIKTENRIYVKFDNNSLAVIADGAVTVEVDYAEAASGLDPAAAAAVPAALPPGAWNDYGSYVMTLIPPPDPPPGYGLTSGPYPTSYELDSPELYSVECSSDCDQPLPASFFLRVTLSSPPGEVETSNNTAFSYYDQAGGLPSSDVVILHDVSGSMSDELAVAKQRAKMFVDLLNAGDRVAVVAFSSQFAPDDAHAKCDAPGVLSTCNRLIASVSPMDPAKAWAKDGIDAWSAGGWTPMGEGVQLAQQVLTSVVSPNPNRAIVMLTDGKENWGADRLQDPPGYPILDGLISDSIGLYPLWFGTVSDWGKALLEDIDGFMPDGLGKLVEQPSDDLKLAEAYLMIRGILTSDDVYDIHRGTTGDAYQGSIFVDAVTRELILAAAWGSFDRDLGVEVLPPGAQRWLPAGSLAGSTSRDALYVVHRFQAPATGLWGYRIAKARGGEDYVLSALADQVEVLMQSSLASGALAAGDEMVINARLSRAGQGVPGAVVRATVEVPDVALGTLLHQYRGRFQTPSTTSLRPDVPRAAGILAELRKFLGRDQLYGLTTREVQLTDHGDGTYSGRFGDTRVAGTYRITLVAENPGGFQADGFRREHRHAAVVSLGALDRKRSQVSFVALDRPGREGTEIWKIEVVPADVHGNFADPDYASRIQVGADAGTWQGELVDNDDGSYSRYLELPAGGQARVTVKAFGSALEDRTIGDAARGRFSFSLHTGASFPSGTFDRAFDPGPSFNLDFGYQLKPRLTLLALVGSHRFPRANGPGSETVTQLSADLRFRLTAAALAPYVQGGAGAYRIFSNWEPGANLGLGVTFRASPTLDVEGGVDHHAIFLSGSDARFWQAHAGFSFRY